MTKILVSGGRLSEMTHIYTKCSSGCRAHSAPEQGASQNAPTIRSEDYHSIIETELRLLCQDTRSLSRSQSWGVLIIRSGPIEGPAVPSTFSFVQGVSISDLKRHVSFRYQLFIVKGSSLHTPFQVVFLPATKLRSWNDEPSTCPYKRNRHTDHSNSVHSAHLGSEFLYLVPARHSATSYPRTMWVRNVSGKRGIYCLQSLTIKNKIKIQKFAYVYIGIRRSPLPQWNFSIDFPSYLEANSPNLEHWIICY